MQEKNKTGEWTEIEYLYKKGFAPTNLDNDMVA